MIIFSSIFPVICDQNHSIRYLAVFGVDIITIIWRL